MSALRDMSAEEEELFDKIHRIAEEQLFVSVDEVMGWVRKFGVNRLTAILDEGLERFRGKKLLNNKLLLNLYGANVFACSQSEDNGIKLYEHHGLEVQRYLEEKVSAALRRQRGEYLAKEFRRRWDDHKVFTEWMRKMFLYLDKQLAQHGSKFRGPCTTIVSLHKFCNTVFDNHKVEIVKALQDMINAERNGEAGVDRSLLKSVIDCFITMGCIKHLNDTVRAHQNQNNDTYGSSKEKLVPDVSSVAKMEQYAAQTQSADTPTYRDDFETPFLDDTREFYALKGREWIQEDSTSTFLIKAEKALQAEQERVDAYLHQRSRGPLLAVVEKELLLVNQQNLLHKERSGMAALLEAKQVDDLNRMYRLFKLLKNGLAPMATILTAHFKAKGDEVLTARKARITHTADESKSAPATAAVAVKKKKKSKKKKAMDPADDPEYIQNLLDLHRECEELVHEHLGGDPVFEQAMKSAFEYIVHKEPCDTCTNAEVLCTYCDKVLKGRRGKARLNETEVEKALQQVVCLFRYLKDKDMFAESYRHFLSKRLLSGKTLNDAYEKSMITKLKLECGAQVTSKMEGMMNNLQLGRERRAEYAKEWNKDGHRWDFTVTVLQTGFWPNFFNPPTVRLAPELRVATEHYAKFYGKKFDHRKLTWVLTQGRATLRSNALVNGHKEFDVTTLQAIALLCFNEKETWTFNDLCTAMGLGGDTSCVYTAKRVLHPLSCAKEHDILIKKPKSKVIDETDTFTFNKAFKHQKRQIVMHTPSLEERRHKIREVVDQDRLNMVDAAIVRVMKARRTMTHVELVTESLSQIRLFSAEPRMIKKRIESLIERQYIERREGERGTYDYLA